MGELHKKIIERYAPASALVEADGRIVHLSENVNRFLQLSGGEPSFKLLNVALPALRSDLQIALLEAKQTGQPSQPRVAPFGENGESKFVRVTARPVASNNGDGDLYLVVFDDSLVGADDPKQSFQTVQPDDSREIISRLQRELAEVEKRWQEKAEQYETAGEELTSVIEELRVANQDFEQSRQEIQTVNEQLRAAGDELKTRNEQLIETGSVLHNLINSMDIATIFLDRDFNIKQFTPRTSEFFNLRESDIGRPLEHLTNELDYADLMADANNVLRTLQPTEREVRSAANQYFVARFLPYRTTDDRIDGVVLTFIDITARKAAENSIRFQAQLLDTVEQSVIATDLDGIVTYWNRCAEQIYGWTTAEAVGRDIMDLTTPEVLAEQAAEIMSQLSRGKSWTGEFEVRRRDGATFPAQVSNSPVTGEDGNLIGIVGISFDITTRKRAEANLAFLADFSQALILLTTEREIIEIFGEKINQLTDASICAFSEINEQQNEAVCKYEWHQTESGGLIGKYNLAELVLGEFQKLIAAGETVVVRDINEDSRATRKEQLASLGIGSFVNVPLIREGDWKFVLGVYHDKPYNWRDDEVDLLNESAKRIWAKIERIRDQDELRESEERLQQLIKNLPGGAAFIVDRNLRYLLAGGEALAEAGFAPEDFVGKIVFDALAPGQAEDYGMMYRKVLAGETFTHEHDQLDGGTYLTRGTPLRATDGRIYAALAVSYDISDRKKAEEKLRESEERLRLIINSVEDYSIITTDTEGIVTGWNPGAEKSFGYTEPEIVGKSAAIIFTPEDREQGVPEREMQTAMEKGRAEDERFHLRSDGSRFFVSGVTQPLKDGKIDGFVKIARDMTERSKLEQIEREKLMLQKLVGAQEDERKRIARDLHDELGQLLTGLRLKLEAVGKLCEGNQELRGKVDDAQLLAKHLDDGVDFLAWELRPAALDDLGLCAALTKYIREWSHYSGITAELLESGITNERFAPEAETNLYRIAQEALNNVYKHAEARRAEVILDKRDGDLIVLIIEDDGVGFDPADKMNRDKGIGLIGMTERAALIGGSLEIESAPGKGTTIFVRVPASFLTMENANDE